MDQMISGKNCCVQMAYDNQSRDITYQDLVPLKLQNISALYSNRKR